MRDIELLGETGGKGKKRNWLINPFRTDMGRIVGFASRPIARNIRGRFLLGASRRLFRSVNLAFPPLRKSVDPTVTL
jgi:hypothetical protein